MEFVPIGHLNTNFVISVDFANRLPWLYVIYCLRTRLIYVGETQNPIERLSTHFGPYTRSTLRQAAGRVGYDNLRPPFLVVAARLPADDCPDAPFDASSKKVRQLCEALVHSNLAQRGGKWRIMSTPQPSALSANPMIERACVSISNCCATAVEFLSELAVTSPFSLVTLSARPNAEPADSTEDELGALLARIEIRLHKWLKDRLESEFGDQWWTEGIPKTTRLQCSSRMEEESIPDMPREAYLTLIDFRDIIRSNWQLFGPTMERMVETNGKDRATRWLVELNDIRKLWAHPIKRMFLPLSEQQRRRVEMLWQQLGRMVV